MIELAVSSVRGLFNIVGPEVVSRYEFAHEAARAFGLTPGRIRPVSTLELGQVAARPLQAGLRTDKAQSLLRTRLLGYREGLAQMAAEHR